MACGLDYAQVDNCGWMDFIAYCETADAWLKMQQAKVM